MRKLSADLGTLASPEVIRAKMAELMPVAQAQLMKEI